MHVKLGMYLWLNNKREDTDGFVLPSLEIGDLDRSKSDVSEVEASKPSSPKAKKEENIYLGPHGAPPSQSKQQEPNSVR
ncbi:hypothetical protein CFP56_039859 [Quercus suber]|uniref:Uncharacterized protein n=1 Tax=Quercus suber TaxID=58331 RepID=A0AAW0LP03_QUESU